MKKACLQLTLMLFVCAFSKAQNTDSLYRALEDAKDLQRATLLMKVGDVEISKDPSSAFGRFQEALNIFKEEGDTLKEIDAMLRLSTVYLRQGKNDLAIRLDSLSLSMAKAKRYLPGWATAHFNIGRYLNAKGMFREAITHYQQCIELRIRDGKENQVANAYNQIGVAYKNLSQYDDARKYYTEGIAMARRNKDETSLAVLYMNLGNAHAITGNYQEALDNQLLSIRIKEKTNDRNGLTQSYINTSNIYSSMNQPDLSLEYLYKALGLKESIQNPRSLAFIYNNMGVSYARKYMMDSAQHYFERSLEVRKKANDKAGMAQSYVNLGNLFRDQKAYEKSLDYYMLSLKLRESLQSKDDLANIYSNIGTLYTKLGQPSKGEEYLLRSLKLYKATGAAAIKETLYNLSALYELTGDTGKAADYRNEFLDISDSLINDEVKNRLVKLQAAFEIERKENQLRLNRQENEIKTLQLQQSRRQMWGLAIALVFTLILLGVFIQHYTIKRRSAAQLKQKNDHIELLIRELHHRVKNNLQTISSLLSLQSFRVTDENARSALREGQSRIEAMSLIHQKLYIDDNLRGVDMEEYLQALIQTLAASFGYQAGIIKSNIEAQARKLDVDLAIPIGLIINELMINAFKHAFHSVQHPELKVSLKKISDSKLELLVRDNGPGIQDLAASDQRRSFGMKLIQTLTRQLNGSFSVSNAQGAVFQLTFDAPL